jgi:diguanylate cyclase (GGDEF)-like protein/PAS domain S-box-containing protein
LKRQLKILHVEDDPLDADLMSRVFKEAGYDVAWTRVETEAGYLAALASAHDVVIADYTLPQFSGLRALELQKQRDPDIPFILVSGTIGEEKAAEAMRLGAHDYLLKDRLGRLVRVVADALDRVADRKAKADIEAGLRRAQAMAKLAHVITGPDGAFETWSETLPQLAGVEADRLPGSTRAWLQIVHPQDRDLLRAKSIEAGNTHTRTDVEYRLQRPDGASIHVRQTMEPLTAERSGSRPTRWFNTLQDISDQVRAQERISRLNRVYAVLSGINAAIVRIRDRQELFEEACRIAVEAGRFVMAWIGVVDRDAALVRPIASAGDVRGFFDTAPMAVLESKPGGHGVAGRAIRAKAPMISNDVRNDAQRLMRKELDERGINSLAIIPLIVDDEAVGVLALYAAEVGVFDDDEIRLLRELAGDISFALDHIEKANQLEYLAYYDSLTGLANRKLFLERLEQKLIAAKRAQRKLAVSIVDIERFKAINDALGRQVGDELLKQIAERITASGPDPTRVARIGADHFAIVSADLETAEDVGRLTERRLEACLAPPFRLADQEFRVSARVGIAIFPSDGREAEGLFANAEAALKKAKASGERYLFFAPAMTDRIHETLSLENKLRQALEKDEFVLHYQPKVELEARRIVGLEALIRWRSPELGLVPPVKFIPLLEETGLIIEVGSWALKRAALDHRTWAEAGLKPPKVSVNVSAIQLRQRDFVSIVEQAIMEGLAPTGIDLEITESLIMENIQTNIEKLILLRKLGVQVAIDDFGTGYSSLSYLARLPVETLKIDRSFIITMLEDPNTTTLVQTMITLAHSFRLKVVAEGVESEDQAKMLRLLGCDQMQGYLFSKPLPSDGVAALLGRA